MCSLSAYPLRPPRFPVAKAHAVVVHVWSEDTRDSQTVAGTLLDLSPGGAKVLLATPFRFQQAVMLRLECPELSLYLCLAARVCWIRPTGEQWQLGCSFDPPLPDEDLQRLLSEGVLDRRRCQRKRINHGATASWELNSKPTEVTIVDLSGGGFCLHSPLPAEPAGRLKLQVIGRNDQRIDATATVQWRMQTEEGYLLGCSVPHAETNNLLQTALADESILAAQHQPSRMPWYLLVAAACLSLIRLIPLLVL